MNFFHDRSIMTRLILSFISIALIPLSIVGLVSYTKSVNTIVDQTVLNRSQNLKQLANNIEFFMKDLENLSMQIYLDEGLQNTYSSDFLANSYPTCTSLEREFSEKYLGLRKGIASILFYPENGIPLSMGTVLDISQLSDNNEIYQKAAGVIPADPVWIGTRVNEGVTTKASMIISHVRAVYKMKGYMRRLGVIEIQIDESEFREIYSDAYRKFYLERQGFVVIVDENNIVVSHPEYDMLAKPLPFEIEVDIADQQNGYFFLDIEEEKHLATFETLRNTDWKIIDLVIYKNLVRSTDEIKNITIFIMIIGILVSTILSILLSYGIVNPIRKIIRLMRVVEDGNLDIKMDTDRQDEIGQLSRSFVHMTGKVKNLLDSVARKEIQKKEAEISALQAQITPHFLYNTLNSIKCMAAINKLHDIEKMCSSLINLLKINIDRTGFIKFADELKCVQEYFDLQKYRYPQKIDLDIDIKPEIYDLMIPKLTLQPVVENYFIHGFDPLCSEGKIEIKGMLTEDELILQVRDNGIGMDDETLQNILSEEKNNQGRRRIGLRNVDSRLKLYYGQDFGVRVESKLGEGTTVYIRLPKVRVDSDDSKNEESQEGNSKNDQVNDNR